MSSGCRICGSELVTEIGHVQYFARYDWPIFDCRACGCRFAPHDDSVYDSLHSSGSLHYYRDYRDLAEQSKRFFDLGDSDGLERHLSSHSKYRFIIDKVSEEPTNARILEIGCSRGYLTSWFILGGRKILGVDVSGEALDSARSAFGERFVAVGDPAMKAGAPYDVIYHVGMIGCVADPVGLTRQLILLLRPGGKLFFNAPNRAGLYLRHQLWLDSAPPPDLVTLFPEGFWTRQFSREAMVSEAIEKLPDGQAVTVALRRLAGRRWRVPVPRALDASESQDRSRSGADKVWEIIERAISKGCRLSRLERLAPKAPSDFGLFVTMVRHGLNAN